MPVHAGVRRAGFSQDCWSAIFSPNVVTTTVHPDAIAGKAPTLSPYASASPGDFDKQHELSQVTGPFTKKGSELPARV